MHRTHSEHREALSLALLYFTLFTLYFTHIPKAPAAKAEHELPVSITYIACPTLKNKMPCQPNRATCPSL